MSDIQNIFVIIQNFLNLEFNLYGFTLSWGNVLMFSLLGSLFFGVLIHFFKSHE